jgi:nucleoside-diphosphate-sugar epimerase
MKTLVTGSSGHLGEALVRTLRASGHEVVGLDVVASPFTDEVGSIVDRAFVRRCLAGVRTVFHAATLHKPHVATHSRQDFIDTNIAGTLNLLEASASEGVDAFVYSSTTSVFGDALVPPPGEPTAWITEDTRPIPKNIYGVTKAAAEDLCQLFHRNQQLPCIVLRISRFFLEADDDRTARDAYADDNIKVNETLNRRVDIEDVVGAHLLAADRAREPGFRRYIVSAPTPFTPEDVVDLRIDARLAIRRRVPGYEAEYVRRGWNVPSSIDRVYVSDLACKELGWQPRYDFGFLIKRLKANEDTRSPLARTIGAKGYHADTFTDGPYPVQ